MKIIISAVLGFALGLLSMWIYVSYSLTSFDKLGMENSISNTIMQIELINSDKHEELKQLLISGLPCQIKKYEELLSNSKDSSNLYSGKLITQAKGYSGDKSCPN